MNRSLAALAAAAMFAATLPAVGFAEETTTTVETEASVETTVETRACDELTGLRKAQCIMNIRRAASPTKKDRTERRNDERVLKASSECKDLEGREKTHCLREHGRKPLKAIIRRAVKREVKRTIRGKLVESSASSSESSESSED